MDGVLFFLPAMDVAEPASRKGEKVSVRAYDARNRLLGDTPLPDPEVDPGRFPGVDRGTRLVD